MKSAPKNDYRTFVFESGTVNCWQKMHMILPTNGLHQDIIWTSSRKVGIHQTPTRFPCESIKDLELLINNKSLLQKRYAFSLFRFTSSWIRFLNNSWFQVTNILSLEETERDYFLEIYLIYIYTYIYLLLYRNLAVGCCCCCCCCCCCFIIVWSQLWHVVFLTQRNTPTRGKSLWMWLRPLAPRLPRPFRRIFSKKWVVILRFSELHGL